VVPLHIQPCRETQHFANVPPMDIAGELTAAEAYASVNGATLNEFTLFIFCILCRLLFFKSRWIKKAPLKPAFGESGDAKSVTKPPEKSATSHARSMTFHLLPSNNYFNSSFNKFASLTPASATRSRASFFACVRYAGVSANGPSPSPIGAV